MQRNHLIHLKNTDGTKDFAKLFARYLVPGDFVALTGPLGCGKTTLTQYLCYELGVTQNVTSPTFTLMNEYDANGTHVCHGDFYRLVDTQHDITLVEFEETLVQGTSICLVEWAECIPHLSTYWRWHLTIAMDPQHPTQRTIDIGTSQAERLASLITELPHDLSVVD